MASLLAPVYLPVYKVSSVNMAETAPGLAGRMSLRDGRLCSAEYTFKSNYPGYKLKIRQVHSYRCERVSNKIRVGEGG